MKRGVLYTLMALVLVLAMATPAAAAEIRIAKNAEQHPGDPVHPVGFYLIGQEVHYEMEIENTHATDSMTITITDLDPSGTLWYYNAVTSDWQLTDPETTVTLIPGEIWEHDFHHIIQEGDLFQQAGFQLVVNRLFADGIQGQFDIVEASITATVAVVQPEITVTKEASHEFSKVGDWVNYTITIENTGDWPLENITVVDDVLGDLSGWFVDTLAPGESDTQVFPYEVQAGDPDPLVNVVTATGLAEGFDEDVVADIGPVVMDTATAEVDLVHPCLALSKEADVPFTKVGDTVNYTVVVTNCGDVDMEVLVEDSLVGVLFDDILAAGASETIIYPYIVQEGDPNPLVNTVTAVGTLEWLDLDNIIGPLEVSIVLDLVDPGINIVKECDPDTAAVGAIITYTITIENTGDVDLENVTVWDSLLGDLSPWFVDYLAVGESDTQTFDRAIQDTDPNPLVNIARVDATVIILGNDVWAEDECEVTIVEDDFAGCTPGYWRANAEHWDAVSWGPTGYSPDDLFSDVFGRTITVRAGGRNTIEDPTLLEALSATGGDINALARHAVAALLNAAHPDVNYPVDVAYVIAATQAAIDAGEYEEQKDEFEMWNELGCPIDMHGNLIMM